METNGYRAMLGRLNELYPKKEYLSRAEAADVLGISAKVLNKLVDAKKIKVIDTNIGGINRHYIIAKTEIARWGT